MGKLERKGYVACRKAFVGRRPKSTYRITAAGRRAFAKYLQSMQALIEAVEAEGKLREGIPEEH